VAAHDGSAKRSFRCRVGLHRYRKAFTEDGLEYTACTRCGKTDDTLDIPVTPDPG
jgi:hypothetical protein